MIDKSNITLMQMPNAAVEDIWLPQKNNRESYHHPMPPDVVPHYQDKMDWHTIPRGITGKKKSLKRTPQYENVVVGVKPKDYIELTKTVKNSLILSKEEESHTPEEVALNVPERPPTHTTYKMPPLTPTVANLIHTSSVLNKSYSKVGSGSKVMKPVSIDSPIAETGHLVTDGPEEYRNRSYPAREYRNRSRNYTRACILKGEPTISYEDDQEPTRPSRHSWTSALDESTSSPLAPSISSNYSTGTIPLQSEKKLSNQSKDFLHPPSQNSIDRHTPSNYHPKVIQHYSAGNSPQKNSSLVQEQTTTLGRSLSKRPSNPPPPPPRRSPSTKLTKSSHARKESVSSSNSQHSSCSSSSGRKELDQSNAIAPDSQFNDSAHLDDINGSSPEDELPVLPPRLPLYDPSVRNKQEFPPTINPNLIDLPAPPPPPPPPTMLLDKQPIDSKIKSQDLEYNFPPPPPPPLL